MAGLLDGFFGGPDGGIIGTPPGTGPGYEPTPRLVPQEGFMDRLNGSLSNPLTLFGLGLASGKTPQEGFGNAARMGAYGSELQNARKAQEAAFQAAIAQGATPEQARALAMNPVAFKAMQPQFHTLKTGLFGEETPVFISPFGGVTTAPGYGAAASAATNGASPRSAGALPESYGEDGKDEDFLKSVERQYGSTVSKSVKDITEGRMPAMGRNLQQLIPLASRYDKNFTGMQDYQTRLNTAKSFAPGGKDYANVKSYNQAVTHAEQAWDLIPKIEGMNVGGVGGKLINGPYGEARAFMNSEFANNRARYDNLINALSGELSKAAKSTGAVSVEEIRSWRKNATSASSGAEMRGAIQGGMDFLHGAMEATAKGKAEGMKSQIKDPSDILDEQKKKSFDRIQGYQEGKKEGQAKSDAPSAMPAGARQAPDGNWYVPDPTRPGKYLRIRQ